MECPSCLEMFPIDEMFIPCDDCKKESCRACVKNSHGGFSTPSDANDPSYCEKCYHSRRLMETLQDTEECTMCKNPALPSMFFNCHLCEKRRCFRCVTKTFNDVEGYCKTCSEVCCSFNCENICMQPQPCGLCDKTPAAYCELHDIRNKCSGRNKNDGRCQKKLCQTCVEQHDGQRLFCARHKGQFKTRIVTV